MSWLTWLRSEQPAVPRQDGYSIIEPVGRAEFAALAGRVTALERAVSALSAPLSDQARVYYHRDEYGYGDLPGPAAITGAIVPWVSKGVRFVEQLTSPEFVRATRSEAMLLGVSFTILGAGAAWLLALPWYAPMVIGFAGFAVSTGVLIVHNRTLLHATVNQQGKAGEKRRAELRVQVDGVGEGGNHSNSHAEFLYLKCAVNAAQLTE